MNTLKDNSDKRIFSVEEVASMLGVHPSSVDRWAESGKLEFMVCENEVKGFSTAMLKTFAVQFNISLNFLSRIDAMPSSLKEIRRQKSSASGT